MRGEGDHLANAANFAAFVYHEISGLNWAGFYYPDGSGDLVLGPFQGRPACTRLPKGKGVCGKAFASGSVIVVDDVNEFTGHITCDTASRSEIVVPLKSNGRSYGVFDVDSPQVARFGAEDRAGIERLVGAFTTSVAPR